MHQEFCKQLLLNWCAALTLWALAWSTHWEKWLFFQKQSAKAELGLNARAPLTGLTIQEKWLDPCLLKMKMWCCRSQFCEAIDKDATEGRAICSAHTLSSYITKHQTGCYYQGTVQMYFKSLISSLEAKDIILSGSGLNCEPLKGTGLFLASETG